MNYPVFVASFTAAVRGAESSSAVAAVAAATAAAAAAATSAATVQPKLLRKCPQSGEANRCSSKPVVEGLSLFVFSSYYRLY